MVTYWFRMAVFVPCLAIAGLSQVSDGAAGSAQVPVVRQTRPLSCGAAALATLLSARLGTPVTEDEVVRRLSQRVSDEQLARQQGYSLLDLRIVATEYGMDARGYRGMDLAELEQLAPLIVPLTLDQGRHFVVFRGRQGNEVSFGDPLAGERFMPVSEFRRVWIDRIGFSITPAVSRQPGGGP